ncbi:MAG TPA: 3'(2'),5'-bisphosphate nucleotidase [Alteromonas australica]|uniref:3'(2'),5'-bisphosphate nucleotidase CysQ n=1 Tax=Alteromonas australica TaxID=589873 RepID=A0A075P4W6_9ALTE|nr:3'(2'),5'-bisphosphate nucleotidase CysQ [Alteromonas australica]MBU35110.1 3'(2'),5'-bisphosphate nucleotidase [Alteromonas sp.]AIF98357.1 3'-5'-bisphosphate nucleotidase [Alteromonas australica]HAI72068.1 3'(2'),5'-bisphosphate nucleotidase [Alteromonas australica]HAW74715.1 3'(2'),5'-bisphosphate nucleotidase [Alteromonas australica]HBU51937.1 3'(2'),5'-bisphosphate nucleotidase [Alteromonas australica]|tara:strand:- start:3395 stop:4186 length:792 start_codon:yes stop_codon:yes gene_type:complete
MSVPINSLTQSILGIAKDAGAEIMAIYEKDFAIYEKQDTSPLTEADLAAHNVIVNALESVSDLPILSEESADIAWDERKSWQSYWLVDPLDGTKEFIKKNGEFTVNIALIEDGKPTLGVVYAPALNKSYVGVVGEGAWTEVDGAFTPISARKHDGSEVWKIVGSRSHQSPEIQNLLAQLSGDTELVAMGSSLKLCLVAEGEAHLYPRLGPTSEWDTGAAHAVALAAGANVTVLDPANPLDNNADALTYNQKESVLNPFFLVSA